MAKTIVAEGVGFEPTLRFPVNTLSKRAPSATRPPLRTALPRWRTHPRARQHAPKVAIFPAMRRDRTSTVGRHYSRHNRSDKALSQSQVGSLRWLRPALGGVSGPGRFASCQAAVQTTF